MAYKLVHSIREAEQQIESLVSSFKNDIKNCKDKSYNETQLRNDYLNPFLLSLGWDVFNESCKTSYRRDVLQEESIDVEGEKAKKSPDYTLRIDGSRRLFVEAKKPSVSISHSKQSAFQVRRYGWNAGLNISILSNFEYLIIYDCRYKPAEEHEASVARYRVFHYEEYLEKLDEILSLLSFQSVNQGCLESLFEQEEHETESFDQHFLNQISDWREKLAIQIYAKQKICAVDLNLITQKLINRIVFLRICEDRELEKYEALKNIGTVQELKDYFKYSDDKYDSGLFDLVEDSFDFSTHINDELLVSIFQELYYPYSPYDFSVIESSILSQIYERFLGDRIEIIDGMPKVIEEPEVSASKGVVPTPSLIVSKIVRDCLDEITENKSIDELRKLKLADICCGSGTFLLQIFEYQINRTLEALLEAEIYDSGELVPLGNNDYELSLHGKVNVLLNNIFGVDVNPYAIEVAYFSLLVKLLEGESEQSVAYYMKTFNCKILPKLDSNVKVGNSLLDDDYFEFNKDAVNDIDLISKLSPFNWQEEFPTVFESGGFDAILGNPPYVRIQNLKKYTPEEILFYQSKDCTYKVSKKNTIDKYYIFLERAIELVNTSGHVSYIVPSKFAILKGGAPLRDLITTQTNINRITHFGTTQVFQGRSTYTAIIHLTKSARKEILFKRINDLSPAVLGNNSDYDKYPSSEYGKEPWIFLSSETRDVFNKIYAKCNAKLGEMCNIVVGVQNSADDIYIFTPEKEDELFYFFTKNGDNKKIEKSICKPCIYDLSFKMLESIKPNAQMIFPYKIEENRALLIDEDILRREFSNCWTYLNENKDRLLKRNLNGKNPVWYQFGRSQSLAKFEDDEKILWPVLSLGPNYVLDTENILFTGGGNGPYYALTKNSDLSLKFILALLVHPVIESIVKSRASEFRGDYYSHGKQFLENLPVLVPDSKEELLAYEVIIELVSNLIERISMLKDLPMYQQAAANKQISLLLRKLVSEVSNMFSIGADEVRVVLQDEAFS